MPRCLLTLFSSLFALLSLITVIVNRHFADHASGVFHTEYLWVLSRDGGVSNPTRQNIYEKLDNIKINRSGLQVADRTNCPVANTSLNTLRESDENLANNYAYPTNKPALELTTIV